VVALGPAALVTEQYVAAMKMKTKERTPQALPPQMTHSGTMLRLNENRFGSQEMQITAVHLQDANQIAVTELAAGEPLTVEIACQAAAGSAPPIVGVTVSTPDGTIVYDTSTETANLGWPESGGQSQIRLHLARLDLQPGQYFVDVGLYQIDWSYAYDYHWHVYSLLLTGSPGGKGVLNPPHTWEYLSGTGSL
ncbi:MAG: Wzt carbohydrate-binding domain-containing protein, partial [Anaerolineales bacterium]|nr:Wzt carbohydrate-binding domain-containing protein [Anaerolineales bacterium]